MEMILAVKITAVLALCFLEDNYKMADFSGNIDTSIIAQDTGVKDLTQSLENLGSAFSPVQQEKDRLDFQKTQAAQQQLEMGMQNSQRAQDLQAKQDELRAKFTRPDGTFDTEGYNASAASVSENPLEAEKSLANISQAQATAKKSLLDYDQEEFEDKFRMAALAQKNKEFRPLVIENVRKVSPEIADVLAQKIDDQGVWDILVTQTKKGLEQQKLQNEEKRLSQADKKIQQADTRLNQNAREQVIKATKIGLDAANKKNALFKFDSGQIISMPDTGGPNGSVASFMRGGANDPIAIAMGGVNQNQQTVQSNPSQVSATQQVTQQSSNQIPFSNITQAAAEKTGLSSSRLSAQQAVESSFRANAVNQTDGGSSGVAQFQPATARALGIDPMNPEQAIPAQAGEMKRLLERFKGDNEKALAAYNWGEGNLSKALIRANRTGQDWKTLIPKSTQEYITKNEIAEDSINNGIDPLKGLDFFKRTGRKITEFRASGGQQVNATQTQQVQGNIAPQQTSIPAGTATPVQGYETQKTREANKDRLNKTLLSLGRIDEALKELDTATSGGAANLLDRANRYFGSTTEGAKANKRLATIGGKLLSNIPHDPGSQSDAELKARQALIGDISNGDLTREERKAALEQYRLELQKEKDQLLKLGVKTKELEDENKSSSNNSNVMTALPDASKYKGRKIRSSSGKVLISNGSAWVESK